MVVEQGGTVEIGTETTPISQGNITIKLYGSWQDPCMISPSGSYKGDFLFCPGSECPSLPTCGSMANGDCPANYGKPGMYVPGPNCGGPYGVKAIAVGTGGTLDIHGKKGVPPFFPGLQSMGVQGKTDRHHLMVEKGLSASSMGWP